MKIDPRLKIIYLILVSLLAFTLGDRLAYGLLALQVVVWALSRIPLAEARYLRKAVTFILVVLLFYVFFTGERDFILFSVYRYDLKISSSGFFEGLRMCLRFLTILIASIIIRRATPRDEFIQGLLGLKLSRNSALLFDSTLSYLEGKDESPGRRENGNKLVLKRLFRGDLSFLIEMINSRLAAARERFADSDLAVIFGLTIVVASVRFLKVAPAFPLAPGHKNLVIVPCFILAANLTRTKFAATQIGFVSGIINFLSGSGRFGVFDILQSMAPGLVVDLLVRLTRRFPSVFVYALIGVLAGLARVTTVLVLALLFKLPAIFYATLAPLVISQCVFGALSAPIAKYLVKNIKA